MKLEETQTDLDRRLAKIKKDLLASDIEDLDWLLETVALLDRALQTIYWIIHGSENGRVWSGHESVETTIQNTYQAINE